MSHPIVTDQSSGQKSSSMAASTTSTAAQQGDNIAHALAGAGGGLLSMALTFVHYPLITLSTRAQVESKRAHSSTLDAARRIVQREGAAGLYSGLDSALFGISVTNFVYYYWYEWTRALFERRALASGRLSKNLTTIESMAAGALAGSATVLITNPIWVINTRMTARSQEDDDAQEEEQFLPTVEPSEKSSTSETSPTPNQKTTRGLGVSGGRKKKPTTVSTFLSLIKDEGPLALFSGVLPALVLVINPILQYTIFEQLKNLIETRRTVGSPGGKAARISARESFLLGALGKLLATSITYPYITVKSRMHVAKKQQSSSSSSSASEGSTSNNEKGGKGGKGGKGANMFEGLRKIVNEEGWAGLYGGIGPKVTQSVLTAAFLFAFKDVLYEASVRARKTVPGKIAAAKA
ncbi:hypothetical protein MMC25_000944 [Agyrium rufum]|nr:hypothetical protein [Agyrium rufum]